MTDELTPPSESRWCRDGATRREGTEDRWYVMRGRGLLATGASAREAVDRAVFLWGER